MCGAATVALVALGAAGLVEPAGATEAEANRWAVTRDADGGLRVVRGREASVAVMDNRLGRMSAQVLAVEERQEVRQLGDPLRKDQWALNNVGYEKAWSVANGSGVTVAVVDTGVLGSHQDLAGKVVNGIDLADDKNQYDPWGNGAVDPGGHGTHVAGIIAGRVNNGVGIAGAAPGVKIMPVRVLNKNGGGTTDDVAEGVIWAANHGARIINLSLGGGPSPGIQAAIQYARSKRAVTFAAAGNFYLEGNTPTYPAVYPEAVAVAATNAFNGHASFSNTGSYVDIAAPGDYIWSTYGKGSTQYAVMSGTSMATPYAAAVGALMLSSNPKLSPSELINALQGSATDIGAPGRDNTYGHGLVNPRAALLAASPTKVNRGTKGNGYWVVGIDGRVRTFGNAKFYGDLRHVSLSAPVVAAARTPSGKGYWLATSKGAVYGFGDARYLGSMRGKRLNSPIVGMAATPTGQGYILLGQDGGIFTFGNARFYGSTGSIKLNSPVRDLTITANGKGYWFVAGDGGVFSYGNARFKGSTASKKLAKPVRSMTAAADGSGYWMIADDGGIFAFSVPFVGSLPGVRSLYGWPYVSSIRMRSLKSNDGYYILGLDGTVWAMGNARYWGSAKGMWATDIMQAP
jgi:hypothetical protein